MIHSRLAGREHDLGGGFLVRRLLPQAGRRSIGPFIFFDHFGPAQEHPGTQHDVRPHPHIGLATVTYLFEGAMLHRDSLGTVQRIEPGAINWMTAGRGIVHSERKPDDLREARYVNHGLQLWAALPLAQEEAEPAFSHTPADAIPALNAQGVQLRVLVGEAFGLRSPVPALSPTLYLDVRLAPGAALEWPMLAPEQALYLVDGELAVGGQALPARQLVLLEAGPIRLQSATGAHCVLIGGAPLDAPRHMWWNFVSSRRERILQAAADWEAQRMPKVPGDEAEFIPLPPTRLQPAEPMS